MCQLHQPKLFSYTEGHFLACLKMKNSNLRNALIQYIQFNISIVRQTIF